MIRQCLSKICDPDGVFTVQTNSKFRPQTQISISAFLQEHQYKHVTLVDVWFSFLRRCRRSVTVRVWVRSPRCSWCSWMRRTPSGPCHSCWPIRNKACTVSLHSEEPSVCSSTLTSDLWPLSLFSLKAFSYLDSPNFTDSKHIMIRLFPNSSPNWRSIWWGHCEQLTFWQLPFFNQKHGILK